MDLAPIIEEQLAPVLGRLGFALEAAGRHGLPAWTRSNGKVELIVIHAAQHCEASLHLRSVGNDNERIPLSAFLGHLGDDDAVWSAWIQVYEPERATAALQRVGAALERNASHLANWSGFFAARLLRDESALAEEAGRKERLKIALGDADWLWRERRYRDYVLKLAPHLQELSPASRKKLGYARKKAGML